jgi:site-specific DNA recombinase
MIQKNIQPNTSIKEIERMTYANAYLIYNRKSTDEPENQKNSIHFQKAENLRFAHNQKLSIAKVTIDGFCVDGIISEKHSAFKEDAEITIGKNGLVQYKIDRPKFHQLIHYVNKGYFKGVIMLCWDRISRNKADEVVIRKLLKTGADFRFVLATYDKSSAGALHMDIDGMFAEHHSRVTSEKVKLTVRNQRAKGLCTYQAPVGYLNKGTVEEKPFDPARAPIIKKMFELYATGEWSLAALATWSIENGFTLAPKRRQKTFEEKQQEEEEDRVIEIEKLERIPTYTSIHRILINPFYIGKIIGNDNSLIRSNSHLPIISEDIFYKVQQELQRKKVCVKYLKRLDHPFRGMIRCGGCQRVYTPYTQKNITYFGTRCQKECTNPNKSINVDFIANALEEIIEKIPLTEKEIAQLDDMASTGIAMTEAKRINTLTEKEAKKKKLREDLAYLRTNKINLLRTGVYTPEAMTAEEELLNKNIKQLQQEEQISDEAMGQTVDQVKKLSELLKTLTQQYIFAGYYGKEAIAQLLFSELYVSEKSLYYQYKTGINVFKNRFVSSCAQEVWLSELSQQSNNIRIAIKELEVYLAKSNA